VEEKDWSPAHVLEKVDPRKSEKKLEVPSGRRDKETGPQVHVKREGERPGMIP